MPKRFTDTDKWKDEWVLSLKPLEKLVYVYILDNCDNAGFYEVNVAYHSFMLGIQVDEYRKCLHSLNRCYILSKDAKKIWIMKFLYHQKNTPLNPDNNAHKQIIGLIKINQNSFEYDFSTCPYLGANKGLFSPIGKGKGNSKGNSKGKVKALEQAELIYSEYPRKEGKAKAIESISKALGIVEFDVLIEAVKQYSKAVDGFPDKTKIPHPTTWFNGHRWDDDRDMWSAWRTSDPDNMPVYPNVNTIKQDDRETRSYGLLD